MTDAIVVEGLTKVYKDGTRAVAGIDFTTQTDQIVCLAGPNGAGKTTTLRMIGTQLLPTSGTVRVLGLDIIRQVNKVREHLAVVPQEAKPDPDLSPWEYVHCYLRARGLTRKEASLHTEEALTSMGLWDQRDKVVHELSGGQRRRVLIAAAFATRAEILLLDEPTAGLDPVARRDAWNSLLKLRKTRSIILTTHAMEEAEVLADKVVIINGGKIVASGTVDALKQTIPAKEKILVEGIGKEKLAEFGEVDSLGEKFVVYPHDKAARDRLLELALSAQQQLSISPTTLDDVYLKIVRAKS